MGIAGETAINLPSKIHGEATTRGGAAAEDGARAAELIVAPRSRPEADQVQDLTHRELLPKLLIINARHGGYAASVLAAEDGFFARWARYDLPQIFKGIAPSTTRSRKAIARGGSPR